MGTGKIFPAHWKDPRTSSHERWSKQGPGAFDEDPHIPVLSHSHPDVGRSPSLLKPPRHPALSCLVLPQPAQEGQCLRPPGDSSLQMGPSKSNLQSVVGIWGQPGSGCGQGRLRLSSGPGGPGLEPSAVPLPPSWLPLSIQLPDFLSRN